MEKPTMTREQAKEVLQFVKWAKKNADTRLGYFTPRFVEAAKMLDSDLYRRMEKAEESIRDVWEYLKSKG